MKNKKLKKSQIDPRISNLENMIKSRLDNILQLEKKIEDMKNRIKQSKILSKELKEIEQKFRQSNSLSMLKTNTRYNELKKELKQINEHTITKDIEKSKEKIVKYKKKIAQIEEDLYLIKKDIHIEILKQKIENISSSGKEQNVKDLTKSKKNKANNTKKSPNSLDNSIEKQNEILPNWNEITFADRKILVCYRGKNYEKHIQQSRGYLNKIKHYYSFHNVPNLIMIVKEREIVKIINEDVLFYHIEFLKNTASYFSEYPNHSLKLETWSKYTGAFYTKNMPRLFHTRTLKKLCEYCNKEFPIIPVGEAIISNHQTTKIHMSFLFPLKSHNSHILAWESIEESKATYLFKINNLCIKEIQSIFDYISGVTPNKRLTLIQRIDLRTQLGLIKRVMHNDMNNWESEIKALILK